MGGKGRLRESSSRGSRSSNYGRSAWGDDNAIEWVLVLPGEPAGENGVRRLDGQLGDAHVSDDVGPRRQECFAVEPTEGRVLMEISHAEAAVTHTLVFGSEITAKAEASTSDGVLTSHRRVCVSNSTFTNRRLSPPRQFPIRGSGLIKVIGNQQVWATGRTYEARAARGTSFGGPGARDS